jgi:DNA-directed RNA polymerase subunit omega
MVFPSLERSLNKVSDRYMLVVLACKRARQINRGAAARVASRHIKPTSMALEEIAAAAGVPREGRRRNGESLSLPHHPRRGCRGGFLFVGVNAMPIQSVIDLSLERP